MSDAAPVQVRLCACVHCPQDAGDRHCTRCGKSLNGAQLVPIDALVSNIRHAMQDIATETLAALSRLTAQADQCRQAADDPDASRDGKTRLTAIQRHMLLVQANVRENVVASVRTYVARLDSVLVRP